MIIPISFKRNETELYDEVCKHTDKSAFIKECIQFYLESKKESQKPQFDGAQGFEIGKMVEF